VKRRHTKRDLARLFTQQGLRANRLLGQNFLVDHNLLQYIVACGDVGPEDLVLEVGAGTGMLTWHLAEAGAEVLGVEIDENLFDILADYVGDRPNVHLLRSDIHGAARQIHPEVLAKIEEKAEGRTFKVISNLPYCISSELIVSLIQLPLPVERLVLTVQKEFADRLLARPGSRDYSELTVRLQARADVARVRDLAPEAFWPVPKIGSTIVRIRPNAERWDRVTAPRLFEQVARALFAHRRKTVAGALKSIPSARLPAEKRVAALAAAGITDRDRADALPVARIVDLANAMAES
jgi:16S rRNA (adenine1518-N6/adenine1519-N6)-dimethyltransferase